VIDKEDVHAAWMAYKGRGGVSYPDFEAGFIAAIDLMLQDVSAFDGDLCGASDGTYDGV